MYIPIGPSKKQLYKIVIALLLLCYILFLGMYKPKALTYNAVGLSTSGQSSYTGSTGMLIVEYPQNGMFKNYEGTFIVSFVSRINVPPYNFQMNSNTPIKCDIGNGTAYSDNSTQATSYTAICKGKLGGAGLTSVSIDYINPATGMGVNNVNLGATLYYISNDSAITNDEMIAIMSSFSSQLRDDLNQLHRDIIGNQSSVTNIQNNTQNISDNLNDSSIDSSSANDFTSNSAFQDSNGLDAIIKAPLNFIQSLTSSTCSSISLTIPYINADVSLPCMSTIYNKALGQQLVNLIALVINGVVLYRYCLKILQIVKDAKNPNKDGLEVLDL